MKFKRSGKNSFLLPTQAGRGPSAPVPAAPGNATLPRRSSHSPQSSKVSPFRQNSVPAPAKNRAPSISAAKPLLFPDLSQQPLLPVAKGHRPLHTDSCLQPPASPEKQPWLSRKYFNRLFSLRHSGFLMPSTPCFLCTAWVLLFLLSRCPPLGVTPAPINTGDGVQAICQWV